MKNLMLKIIRGKMGYNQEEMALNVHMTKKDYIKIENSMCITKAKDMIEISKFTGVSMEDLFNWYSV